MPIAANAASLSVVVKQGQTTRLQASAMTQTTDIPENYKD
jgi:hypothetical protein